MGVTLSLLREPFPAEDIEWRVARSGKTQQGRVWAQVLAYITNRAIQDRLDAVCGPENWRNEFREWQGDGDIKAQLCGISIRIEGEWITKWDGAECTDFQKVKGGLSDSMKRAAVQWGIGRYLYDLGESWAEIDEQYDKKAEHKDKIKETGDWFSWKPPRLPSRALPSTSKTTQPPAPKQEPPKKLVGEQFFRECVNRIEACKTAEDVAVLRQMIEKPKTLRDAKGLSDQQVQQLLAHLNGKDTELQASNHFGG